MQTEEEVETYIYDTENFMTALGGNFGLFFDSCIVSSIKIFLIEYHF